MVRQMLAATSVISVLLLPAVALATPVASLAMSVAGLSNRPIIGACSSQASGPVTAPTEAHYELAFPNLGASVTTRPTPRVSANITGAAVCDSAAAASVHYFVQVHGAPGSQVPVDFSGLFSLVTPRMQISPGFSGSTQVANLLLLNLQSREDDFVGMVGGFDATRHDGGSGSLGGQGAAFFYIESANGRSRVSAHLDGIGDLSTESGPTVYDTGPTAFLFSSDFTGSFDGTFLLDIDDIGVGLLQADMSVSLSASGLLEVGAMRAFLDPTFSISADYLAANPGAQLQVLGGFGNQAAAVPAPGSLALALLALLLVPRPHRRAPAG